VDLIVDQLYSIIYFFFDHYDRLDLIAAKDAFVFNTFSTQWLTIILFIPMMALVFIKNLNLMVKLSGYGAYSAVLYFAFVVYKFIDTAAAGQINTDKINWISTDIGNLAGTCALAFTIHTMVVTFLKPNKNQEHNVRDVGFAYMLGFLLYEFIGVLGAFAISGRDCK
jgi:amino acid permease